MDDIAHLNNTLEVLFLENIFLPCYYDDTIFPGYELDKLGFAIHVEARRKFMVSGKRIIL